MFNKSAQIIHWAVLTLRQTGVKSRPIDEIMEKDWVRIPSIQSYTDILSILQHFYYLLAHTASTLHDACYDSASKIVLCVPIKAHLTSAIK